MISNRADEYIYPKTGSDRYLQ